MTLKGLFKLENLPMRLNLNNSAKKNGSKFLHSILKEALPVTTNT